MRRHPPHSLSPARAKPRQGKTPKRAFATSKPPQQRSDRTRKPVKSEQDNCSLTAIMACIRPLRIGFALGRSLVPPSTSARTEPLVLSGHSVDQTCGIEQRGCLKEGLLDVVS